MNYLKNKIKNILDIFLSKILIKLSNIVSKQKFETLKKYKLLGDFFYYFFPIRKKSIIENINLVKSNTNNKEISSIFNKIDINNFIHDIYITQTLNFFEFLWMKNVLNTKVVHNYFKIHNLNYLKDVLNNKSGGIVISAHLGNWELLAAVLGKLGLNLLIITVERNLNIHKTVNNLRTITGNETVDRNHAAIKCLKAIYSNKFIGVMADQHTDNSGVKCKFLGLDCMTTSLPAAFSFKTNAPIYGIFMLRSKDYNYHEIFIEKPIYARSFLKSNKEQAILDCTQAINDMIEKYVLKAPEQWFWFHKRWRGLINE